jgi:hypothetical protein
MSKNRRNRPRENRGAWNPDDEWAIHRQTQPQRQSTRQRWQKPATLPSYKQQINQFLQKNRKKYPEVQAVITEFMMGKFYMRPDVALRFAEYARAAALDGKEIGGFLRVQRTKNGDYLATDLKVFPQTASMAFCEMDGRTRNVWQNEMKKAGRKAELAEWNCMIHSHPPGVAPFLSGTDFDQIKMLGHRRHFWSVIVTADTQQIMNLDWRVHFYHGGMAPDADGMLAPATPPLLVKDMPVDILPSDWKDIHAEVKAAQSANSANFIGESETRSRRGPVGFQAPSQQYAGPNPGGYLIGGSGTQSARQHLDKASTELEAALADLNPDDVPDASLLEPLTEEDMQTLREAGFNPEDMASLQAAMDADFTGDDEDDEDDEDEDSEEVILVTEGSVVTVNEKAMESYGGTAWAEKVQDMVDSEFTVENITEKGHVVVNEDVVLPVDAIDVVQA